MKVVIAFVSGVEEWTYCKYGMAIMTFISLKTPESAFFVRMGVRAITV